MTMRKQIGIDWLRVWRADVLHLHVFWLWPLARSLREQTGIPIVYTVHSLDRAEYELGQGPPECLTQSDLQESLISSADRIVALTQSESALIAAYVPAACGRVRVVGNGIEDCPEALATASRPSTAGPLTVLYSGRFVERKGVRDLLAAVPLVLERAPDTTLCPGRRPPALQRRRHGELLVAGRLRTLSGAREIYRLAFFPRPRPTVLPGGRAGGPKLV